MGIQFFSDLKQARKVKRLISNYVKSFYEFSKLIIVAMGNTLFNILIIHNSPRVEWYFPGISWPIGKPNEATNSSSCAEEKGQKAREPTLGLS